MHPERPPNPLVYLKQVIFTLQDTGGPMVHFGLVREESRSAQFLAALVREEGALYGEGSEEGRGRGEVERSESDGSDAADPAGVEMAGEDTAETDSAEADTLYDLAEEITTLAARIHAATHRLLVLVAEFDRLRGWEREGHRSCAHWLHYRTGIDLGAARERVRTARALVDLPEIGGAMSRGELSFSKVRALTRIATPDDEGDLLPFALESTTATLERAVRGWKKRSRREEADWERALHESRTLSIFPDDDGMYRIRGTLSPEVGALLMRAIEAAGDALYRKDRAEEAKVALAERLIETGAAGGVEARRMLDQSERESARRRADALGLLAEQAMRVGFGGGTDGSRDEGMTDGEARNGDEGTSGVAGTDGIRNNGAIDVVGEGSGGDEGTSCVAGTGGSQKNGAIDVADEGSGGGEGPCEGAPAGGGRSVNGRDDFPISGTRAERYQVVLHVDPATLAETGEPGRSELEDGVRVSAEGGIHFAPLTPRYRGVRYDIPSDRRGGLPPNSGGIR